MMMLIIWLKDEKSYRSCVLCWLVLSLLYDATPRADQFLFPTENKLFCMSKTIRAFTTFDLRSQFSHVSFAHVMFYKAMFRAWLKWVVREGALFCLKLCFSGGWPLDGSRDACCAA